MKEGKLLFAEGKLEKAEKCFLQALKEDPNNKEAYNNVGVIAFQKGDMKKAVDFFTSSLQIDPFYRDAVLNFSAVISKLSQFPEFIPYLEKLIEKYPSDSQISRLLKEATQSEGLRSSPGNERTKGGYQVRNLKISGVDDSAYKKLNTDRSKRVAFVLGVTGNWAFAAATVIVGLKKHLKNITDYDIIIFHSGLSDQEKEALNKIHECIFYEYDIRITKPDKFKRVSKLAFSRFECFDLLNYYETVAWLDSDILILGDISGMINSCQTGISMFLHKNIPMSVSFSDSVQGFDMNMECFNDGIFLINRKLSFREELKNWSYEKTNEYIDAINSDQAIFNLMLQQFDIKVTELAARFNCHPHALVENPVIIHPWGEQKFWNHYNNELWNAYYMEWMSKGGLESNEVKWNLKLDKETLLSSVVARSDFPELLNQLNLTNIGAEIGCQKGKFSDLILSKWKGKLLFSIDPWMEDATGNYKDIANVSQEQQEQNYQETKSLLSIYGNRSKILRKSSYHASLGIEDNCLDFVYIDARHDYKSVLEDVELWTPKVRVGGIIAGHDYMNLKSANLVIEVKKAVDEYFGKMGWKIYRTLYDTIAYPSWWVVKQSSLTSIDDKQDNCKIDKCKVDCNEMSDRSKNLRGKEYSNLIDLKEFFRGVDDYVILKLSEDFPDYSAYSDIDVLCRDRDAFLSHILTVGKAYERRGLRIEVNREGDNLHVDLYPPKAERLNFRFDLLDCLSYEKFSVDSQLCDIILNNRQSVNRGGVDIQVPIPEHELAVRFFEYVEWKDKRPDKVKHWEYIKKYYCPQFVEVVNKYTNLNVTVEQANGEIRLNVSAKDLTTDSPKKQRIDYFLIWGHGLQYTGEILDIIRSRKDFEIITIQKIHVHDMSKLVDDIYSCDTVPLQHLLDKTRYLLNTEPQILFILVKNKNPREKLFGEGQFRHIQCQLVKDVKEEIRNKFNPRVDGKRTEHHVIHASDYESQVEHVLAVLGLPPSEYYERQADCDLDVPYHIRPFDDYQIKQVNVDDLFANIITPVDQTPHYKYLVGDKQAYRQYYEKHFGKALTDDHCPEAYDRMAANFEYGRTNEVGKRSLILAERLDDEKYKIIDGVHRAAILKHQDVKTVTIAEPIYNRYKAGAPDPAQSDSHDTAEPLISVIIPCYEQAHFLPEAVESVVGQTYENWECLIVNDGSSDDTGDVARRLIAMHPARRIRLIEKENGGLASARNAGIKASRGKYFLPLDADDTIAPEMLSTTREVLDGRAEVGFVYSNIQHFGSRDDLYVQPEFDADTIVHTDNMVSVCALCRKAMWEQVGGYSEYMRDGYEDWDFWIGCIENRWKGYRVPEPLFRYRIKEQSMLKEATEKRPYLRARIVLNHPAIYSSEQIQNARKIVDSWEKQDRTAAFRKTCIDSRSNAGRGKPETALQKGKINGKGLKLHLGCGAIKIPGFINVDIDLALPAVDVVDDVSNLSRFHDNSTSLIYACHVLEHFCHDEIVPILKRWFQVLEPGGQLRISVPDIDRIVKVYHKNWQHFQTAPNTPWIGLIYGGQSDEYDFHKTGFNFTSLKYLLEQAGFTEIEEYPHEPHWLGIGDASLANEPFKEYISLNIKGIKPRNAPVSRIGHKHGDYLSILHTVEFYYPHTGGAESVVRQLSERLAKRGHHVTIATGKHENRLFSELNGVVVKEFDVTGSLATGISGPDKRKYMEFLLSHPADVMMNYAAQQWATDLVFKVLPSVKDQRVNIIAPCGYSALLDSKAVNQSDFENYFNLIIPTYLPQYDAAIYHSAQYQDYEYAQNHGFSNSVVIPNGTSEQEFSKLPALNFRAEYEIDTRYIGLCVANFHSGKGQDRVIECVRQMNRKDFTMVFVGNEGALLNELKEKAKDLNVKFLIGVPREDVLAAYHTADVFLLGSYKEASPLVIIEAKASRTPFVSTDCGNVREWKGGIVCPAEEMAANINKILDNEILRKDLAEQGWKEWKKNLTWESIVDKYEQLYLRLHCTKTGTTAKTQVHLSEAASCKRNEKESIVRPSGGVGALLFSKDRAMQLQAAIESFMLHCRDRDTVDLTVLYCVSNAIHAEQYEKLKEKFSGVNFIKETDFRRQVLSLIEKTDYVLFIVDDNIFVKDFSIQDIVGAVREHTDAIGFSLRLGANTTYCYSLSSPQRLPRFNNVGEEILKYNWPNQQCDFGYPLEVSSSFYRSRDILRLLNLLEFSNPNTLEGRMNENRNFDRSLCSLLAFQQSVAFCNPVNIVQNVVKNKHGTVNHCTPEELADLFSQGRAIDVEKYTGFVPNAAHQEVKLYFKDTDRDIPSRQTVLMTCETRYDRLEPGWKPKFSVIMASYNNAEYISQAIESLLTQTFKDWELIIVDDCSTDNSLEVIKTYSNDKRIRLVRHDRNLGYTAAVNTGIANINSKYFGILDSDDCLMPRAVEKMYEHYGKYPAFGFVYSQFVACAGDLTPRRFGSCGKIPVGKTNLETNLVGHFKTFRLKDYLKTTALDEGTLHAEDADIIFKMEEVTPLAFVDECLYLHRELPDSKCHGPRESLSKQSWEKAKENARRRRRQVLDRLLGPNADKPAEQLILRETDDAADYKPEFSVVMANYNNGSYVADAIKSVLNQGFQNWELIIVDDGSTDNSLQVIEPYLKDKRIKLIRHEQNIGYAAALRTAIAQLSSPYFGVMDSDDCLARNAVEILYAEHVANPRCGFIYTQFQYCDENLLPVRTGDNRALRPGETGFDCRGFGHFTTFKLADYLKSEGYNEDALYAEHEDIAYKMEGVTNLKFVDKVLYLYRQLPNSRTRPKKTTTVDIDPRAKAKVNAVKRRADASAVRCNRNFSDLFKQAVEAARAKNTDLKNYLIVLKNVFWILRKVREDGGKLQYLNLPEDIMSWPIDDAVLWLAVNVPFKKTSEVVEIIDRSANKTYEPLVSVCMVTYNNDKFIRSAIDSVLAQTYKNFELLIIDDGSTDRTKEVIAAVLVDSDSNRRIRYIYKTHKNFASGVNKAVIEAKGEYILNVDSDDFIEPDYIEKMVTFAEKYPDIDYFYPAALTLVDESGNPTQVEWNYHDFSDNKLLPAFLLDNGYSPIPNPGSLKRRTLFNKVELYEELETVEDFVFLCKNALKIRFKRVEQHSRYFYRRSPASNTFKFRARNELMARALNEMISIYPPELLCPRIAGIKDAPLKRRRYCEYLMMTFYKHANGKMVRYGEYFKQYGDHYKTELSQFSECSRSISTVDAMSDKQSFSDWFKRGVEHLKAARPADALVCFDEALRLGGELANLNYARAVALMQLGRADDARSACEAELAIQRNSQKARTLLNTIAQAADAVRSAGEVQVS